VGFINRLFQGNEEVTVGTQAGADVGKPQAKLHT
jgi:hypothetical protein